MSCDILFAKVTSNVRNGQQGFSLEKSKGYVFGIDAGRIFNYHRKTIFYYAFKCS